MPPKHNVQSRVWTCEHCGIQELTPTQSARDGLAWEMPGGWFIVYPANNPANDGEPWTIATYCSRRCASHSTEDPAG